MAASTQPKLSVMDGICHRRVAAASRSPVVTRMAEFLARRVRVYLQRTRRHSGDVLNEATEFHCRSKQHISARELVTRCRTTMGEVGPRAAFTHLKVDDAVQTGSVIALENKPTYRHRRSPFQSAKTLFHCRRDRHIESVQRHRDHAIKPDEINELRRSIFAKQVDRLLIR
jgi:hypothetical protein